MSNPNATTFGRGPVVQYPAITQAPTPPAGPNISGVSLGVAEVILGPSIQHQSIAQPVIAPPNPAPTVPTGIEVWAVVTPTQVLRRAVMPVQGDVVAPINVPLVAGSSLGWVPVYRGLRGLHPSLMPYTDAMLVPFIPALQTVFPAPTIQVYPDRLVRPLWPNTGTDFVGPWQPIAPPAPPVAKLNPFPNLYRRWFLFDMRN